MLFRLFGLLLLLLFAAAAAPSKCGRIPMLSAMAPPARANCLSGGEESGTGPVRRHGGMNAECGPSDGGKLAPRSGQHVQISIPVKLHRPS
uniref:Putative secreted protein n=1 Tax=Ixodes ricinus TaxID=34613 RepID=A0A6B0UC47_IXORI